MVDEPFELKPALDVYKAANLYLFIWKKERDQQLFERFCRYIVTSLESTDKTISYSGISLTKEYAVPWISHIKKILKICCQNLKELRPESSGDMKTILVYLHTLVAFTGTKTWGILKDSNLNMVRSAMNKICFNIVDYLVSDGFYATLKVFLTTKFLKTKLQ